MTLNTSITGILIYSAMALYGAASIARFYRPTLSRLIFAGGFVVALAAWTWRGLIESGHFPMQNLFEVFLAMGVFIYPISLFCRKRMGVTADALDPLLGFLILFPAGFVFSPIPRPLPPALQSFLFVPHVGVYLLGYVLLFKAGAEGLIGQFRRGRERLLPFEQRAFRLAGAGFPLLTAGLVLGAWWGRIAWGGHWHWDPKEMWSLASWLVFLFYFHFRGVYGRSFPRLNMLLVFLGLVAVILTLTWVNLSRLFPGLHSYA